MDMQHQAMGYDRTATMFSPEGHLLQVEYAEKTVRLGVSSIGMVCSDGVFIIADKRIKDTLITENSSNRIYEIDSHIISSIAGITSDGRVLIDKAQLLAQQHRITYDSAIEPESIIKTISDIKQQFTQYGGARPFGVSLMLAGVLRGVENQVDPGPPVTGNGYAQVNETLPSDWLTTLDACSDSIWLADTIDPEFLKVYLAVKRAEYRQFMAEVSEQDWRWYRYST